MYIEIIKDTKSFKELKPDWEFLEKENINTEIFQTFNYNFFWWETIKVKKNIELNIFVVKENDGTIIAIAPFCIKTEKKIITLKTLEFLVWGDYRGIVIKNKNVNSSKVLNLIFQKIKTLDIDRVSLSNIDIKSSLGTFLKKNYSFNDKTNFQTECPYLILKKYGDFKEYKKEYNNKTLNNLSNKLFKECNYQIVEEENCTTDDLKLMKEMHVRLKNYINNNDNTDKRKSLFLDKDRYSFLERLFKNNGSVLNFYLKASNDEVLGYWSTYIINNKIVVWNIAHNPDYDKYSIGRILGNEIISFLFNTPKYKDFTLDFGCGGYPWKFQLTEDSTSVYSLYYFTKENKKIRFYKKLQLIYKGIINITKALKKEKRK